MGKGEPFINLGEAGEGFKKGWNLSPSRGILLARCESGLMAYKCSTTISE